jgi:acyl dehydratase
MAPTVFRSLDEVRAAVGTSLGTSDWVEVTRESVERFAGATGDRSKSDAGIVPSYLVLSLTNLFLPQVVEVRGAALGINYGTGEVRFPAPAPIGSRVRGTAELLACDEISGGVQTTIRITVEVDDSEAPACVVDSLSRWLA